MLFSAYPVHGPSVSEVNHFVSDAQVFSFHCHTVVFHHLTVFCTSGRVLWPGVVVSPLRRKNNLLLDRLGMLFLRLSFLFNIVKGVYSLPHNAPIKIREYHHYSRSHSLTLKVPYAKTNAFYYSFFCDTLRHWNALPHDIIDSSDAEHFKSKLGAVFVLCLVT